MKQMFISHSVADAWHRGLTDNAIGMLTGTHQIPANPAMVLGKELHAEYEAETRETGRVPKIFKLDPGPVEPELFGKIKVYDWLWLIGHADAVGKDFIIDYKTGGGSAKLVGYQVPLYCAIFGKKKGHIYHYNTRTGDITTASKRITAKIIDETIDWIVSIACDIRGSCEAAEIKWWRDNEATVEEEIRAERNRG